ncbi:MAG: MFS transporter [Coriobacteriales bacterium]|nr:MFS transporter [Coriobacteriales bacterium]
MTPDDRRALPLVLLESAVIVSGSGNGIASVAIPWLVLERTGMPTAAGVVGAATALPLLASSLFSGAVVDTLGRRRTSIVSDILSAFSVAAIPFVDAVIGLNLGLIVVLAIIGAAFDPAGATAREAMLPDASKAAGWRLERTNGVHEASWGIAYLIGPGIGGVLIGVVGAAGALWVTAGAFLVSSALIALLRVPGVGRPEEHERPESIWKGTAEGLRFVRDNRLIRAMAFVTMALVGVYMPIEGVIFPVYFERQQAPELLGFVLMAMSAGAVVGSLTYGAIGARFSRRGAFVYSLLGSSLSVLTMSFLPPYGVLIAAATFAGFFWGPFSPLLNLAMQTRTPPAKRGRVLGVLLSVEYAAGPVAYIIAGPAVQLVGVEAAFLFIGVALVVVAIATFFVPALRELDTPGAYEGELTVAELKPPGSERGL